MTAPLHYQNIYYHRIQSSDTDLVVVLHDHMQAYTSSVGTQTDPEIFYVNGKPARAVQPFRVIPKPMPVQTTVVQTEQNEDGEIQTAGQEEQPHTSGWQQAQWSSAEQEPVDQEIEIQEVEIETEEQEDEEVEEVDEAEEEEEEEVQELASPESEMQESAQQVLQSQQTQTDLQHLQRQLLLFKEEDKASAESK